ncbi:unnamed protein product [Euphydryas editha]|uniref:Uncharacterized protein n=1 Tax=Euphydryas editha TaxID=104508 RepID=A0AAU9TZ63_EUPED|nr:unnamed protein product [Euphydryas editha]
MFSLVNSNFSRTYNPTGRNALSDIKRLLTSRDTESQNKSCGYLIEVISRYDCNSNERSRMVQYLLDNDIVVFLCEATSNLDFSLLRSILQCVRLLWREHRFFEEEHATHALAAVVRALVHYSAIDALAAVDTCLHFICDLLHGIKSHKTTSALSHQSAYNIEQLLACILTIGNRICNKPNTILNSALVLDALISYQPTGLDLKGSVGKVLVETLDKWLEMLMSGLNHVMLVGQSDIGMMLVVTCQLGVNTLRLTNVLENSKEPVNFINKILKDEQEIAMLKECSSKMRNSIYNIIKQLVVFVKENQQEINTEEYGVFLKFLLNFMYENRKTDILPDFCDILFSKGYLIMLPQTQLIRNDITVRKVSILVLGEMLKILTEKYLYVDDNSNSETCIEDINMGLVELQYGIEKPQNIGMQLQKNQSYSLLIYVYFYCQSSQNPEESTAPLLPYLIEYILRFSKGSKPPGYVIKALWLVFAMSTVSNGSLESLDQRVYLEKATDRLVAMLYPNPAIYYTHNPAILFWAFTSSRISNNVKLHVLSEWFKTENSLPNDLTKGSMIWELLLNLITQSKDDTVITNSMDALNMCLDDADETTKEEFAILIWSMLPSVLSKALIDCENELDKNICYILDIATTQLPAQIDQSICLKVAVLITTLYSKNIPESNNILSKLHYEYVCLKMCLLLLGISRNRNENKVLLTFINRSGFLPSVLTATNSSDDGVACIALQLLSYIVFCFTNIEYQPKTIIEIQTDLIIKSLRYDIENERGSSLLQLVYTILNSNTNTPLVLTYNLKEHPSQSDQCYALRGLMFRIQLMLCSRDPKNQSKAAWKTLSSIYKHAIVYKNDLKLVATLTSQPWTHTLIRFQLTQNLTQEFLTFTQNWLTLLKVTIKKGKELKKQHISKRSLIMKTLMFLNNNLNGDEFKESSDNLLTIVRQTLEECNSRE